MNEGYPSKVCERCGGTYSPPTAYKLPRVIWERRRFCSQACGWETQQEETHVLEPRECERCGVTFHPPTKYRLAKPAWEKRRFCGRKCAVEATMVAKNGALRPTCLCGCGTRVQYPSRWVGAHKPEWRDETRQGYIRIYRRDHPLSGKTGIIMEHRYVLYEAGIDPTGMAVHHKNGVRDDNRLENLEVLSHSEHSKLHMSERGIVTNQYGTFPVVRRSPEEQRLHDRDWMRARRARMKASR